MRISVIVTDSKGKPIRDLKPSEFQVLEAGTAQTIEAADLEAPPRGPASPSGAETAPIVSASDETREARRPGTRLIGLFLDEYHVSAGASTLRVRDALRRFVDEEIGPDDLVVVMKPLDSLVGIRMTRDLEAIRQAIASFAGMKGDYAPRSALERELMGAAAAEVAVSRAQVVLSGVRALASHLGGLRDGRKSLVLVSDGFVRVTPRGDERLPDAPSVVRAGLRSDVAIYVVAPEGDPDPAAPRLAMLRALADETGGAAALGPGDLVPGLRAAARDLDAAYRLSYRAPRSSDGSFRAIEVRVHRPGARVRAPPGYWAVVPYQRRTSAGGQPGIPRVLLRPQRRSPLIRPWFGMTRAPDGRTRITFTWVPNGRPSNPAGQASAIAISAKTADGTAVFSGVVTPAQGDGLSAVAQERAVFDVAPGPLAIDLSIQSADQRVLDLDTRNLDVPNLSGPKVVIAPPDLLRTRSALQFRTVQQDPDAAPTVSREFSRAERILLRVPAYGPGDATPTVTAKLLNPVGQTMRALAVVPGAQARGVTQFDLPLASLAPGEYSVEISADDDGGRARELIPIRVVD